MQGEERRGESLISKVGIRLKDIVGEGVGKVNPCPASLTYVVHPPSNYLNPTTNSSVQSQKEVEMLLDFFGFCFIVDFKEVTPKQSCKSAE